MAQGPVPTVDDFRTSVTKPDCFAAIDDSIIAKMLSRKTDYLVAAFGDRATAPILSWDGSCEDAVIAFTARTLMGYRGYKKDAAGDSEFVALDVKADAFRNGIKDKTEHPTFEDSTPGLRPDTPLVGSSPTADYWARSRRGCGSCR